MNPASHKRIHSVVSLDVTATLEARLTSFFRADHNVSDDELALIAVFLATSRASQCAVTRHLLRHAETEHFSKLLQFFLRIFMAAHDSADSISNHIMDQSTMTTTRCNYVQHVMENCIIVEKTAGVHNVTEGYVRFRLPETFQTCLVTRYGRADRLKCDEVWHGDHMAYRCKTCGLSDSSCMCLACFDTEKHEGHDYRVYRCSSGGCCDCGDPLAWKPEGFCKKHSNRKEKSGLTDHETTTTRKIDTEEDEVVQMLVRNAMEFCAETLLCEVNDWCLKPRASKKDADTCRKLPRSGLPRSAFPSIVQAHLDRLQQTLAWLQMLAMSCLYYRNVISGMFFEELPATLQLNVAKSTRSTTLSISNSSSLLVEDGFVETTVTSGELDDKKVEGEAQRHGPLVMLDVFLMTGVLLPVQTCDVLGVLYLKLLFDQSFKQLYTCHFVEWYPYYIELYLAASAENNEDGMRNLSRFIDRLFCQLFHSNAQLCELETAFTSFRPTSSLTNSHGTCCRRRWRHPHDANGISAPATSWTSSSCVEWLMVFLLEKLNDLFRSTLRPMTLLHQLLVRETPSCSEHSTATVGIGARTETPPALQVIQTADCGRHEFKKRVYARLCSDLRTLLVHPRIAAEVILTSYRCIDRDKCVLYETSVYAQLIKAFELLQQMDLQTRHVHRHVEYESQNWTCAFVADYELKLLLSAFLTGIPACFSPEVWQSITTGKSIRSQGVMDVALGSTPLNPLKADTFRPIALARAVLQPVQVSLSRWARRNGRHGFISDAAEVAEASANPSDAANVTEATTITQRVKHYEKGTVALESTSAKSFHIPLHHMYAALIHALCGVVRPQTFDDWCELLAMRSTDAERSENLTFWYSALDHPLRVLFFAREIQAGLWVRNGGVMLQQLIHYHSKHWRYFGLHSDMFLCQLGASFLPHGSFTRFFFQQLPFKIGDSYVLGLSSPAIMQPGADAANTDHSRKLRQELDIVEEALRLLLQLVLAPVKLASASSPDTTAVWLLEREIMHWLALGPFTRSELIMRTDMKLVEQIKQLPAREWTALEEGEILTHVLENVGIYDDPVGSSGSCRTRSGSVQGYGLKMTGSWKLKPNLWSQVSPLFECFTPSEAQQCERNIRKNCHNIHDHRNLPATFISLPMLPRAQRQGARSVDMHVMISEAILNSSYMASVLFIIFENYRRKIAAHHQCERVDSEDDREIPCAITNENLLLAALHCLYVAIEMQPTDITSQHPQTSRVCGVIGSKLSVDGIATCLEEESSLFVKLCTEIPLGSDGHSSKNEAATSTRSLLSQMLFFANHKKAMEDLYPVVNVILGSVRDKSSACSQYMSQKSLDTCSQKRKNESSSDRAGHKDDQPKSSAKEMMKRRQQDVLARMRSQQLQFLTCNGDATVDKTSECNRYDSEGKNLMTCTMSDSHDEATESDEYVEEEFEDEEDEWGFPTGQVDMHLYLDHVSSAIAQIRDKQRRCHDRRRRRRRRQSTHSSSMTTDSDERGHLTSVCYDYGSMDDYSLQTEECGLCRLPCDPRSHELSYGFVGMILPTNMPQIIEKASWRTTKSDIRSFVSSRLPSFRVHKPGIPDSMRMQLADSVIWSCGHAIHHTCLKAYLTSLWKHKRNDRGPLEMANGDDRLLCQRDMDFVCPICRRLSNCLVPHVSLARLHEQALTTEFTKTGFESEEDDGQDPLDFLQWLDTQMSFLDNSPVVKRRRSRAQSSVDLRQRLLSSALKSSSLPKSSRFSGGSMSSRSEPDCSEQDMSVSVEREIGVFCHEIVLRSIRAQLYLPTLLSSPIRDEDSLELEMQQLSSECGAQTPSWQLLLHCLEVQVRVVAREITLLQTDTVDSLQLRSMRQLADITAAAVAFSTPSALTWTEAEAQTDKQFESVMTGLNDLIFGQHVLFDEDDSARSTKWDTCDQLQTCDDGEDTTMAALVDTPILCHPRLLTCFAMRIMWRQRIATPDADTATDQLLTETFFSARVLFTAQVLQSLAFLSVKDDQQSMIDKTNEEETRGKNIHEIRDFEDVESLRDASAWISLLLARCRLLENKSVVSPDVKLQSNQTSVAMEEQVSVLCLPLAQQMLLLMDVVCPMPHPYQSQGSGDSQAFQAATESCAVCDGLFSPTVTSNATPSASVLLDKCLRRLHLPPLRLFFRRQVFPSNQRALCQLWGAQLEAKAAVSRQQARCRALETGGTSAQIDAFPLQQHVKLLSTQAAAIASAEANHRVFIPLPRVYMDLFIRYSEKPTGVCHQCAQVPQHPGLCLFCGEVLCCFSACCEASEGGGVGECTQHAQRCGLGFGAFLLLRACTVILFLGNERRCVWGSIYVDKNGEEDPYLRRGKTLYLDSSRRLAVETLLVSHSFSQNTAMLQNTSRRDGRRY